MAVLSWRGVLIGVVATFVMDLLSAVAYKLGLSAPLPPNLIGRWFASVARAQPVHVDIARGSVVSHELAIAAPVHYAIGVTLALLYLWGMSALGWPARSLLLALAFGLCTNVFPWFLMFPAMGYGFFGLQGPLGTRLFVSSLISHACYGLGIWLALRTVGLS
jgi:hypothetical protein